MSKAHRPVKLHNAKKSTVSLPWMRCQKCFLVYLKNEATAKAIKNPCPGDDDDAT